MDYDYVLIGTGQATGTVIGGLLSQGRKIAVIESDRCGGTCVNWGCTPTKTLVAAARDAHMIRRSKDFGIFVNGFSVDFESVMNRVNRVRNASQSGLENWLRENTDFYSGVGRFLDDHTVEVDGRAITGKTILIHTGTRARIPDIPGLETVPWLDNKGILDLTELPEHLVVIGTSYVGLEFAQAFHRLGSRVSVLGRRSRILPREDADIAEIAREILEAEGLSFHLDTRVADAASGSDGTFALRLESAGREWELEGSHLLVAVGRVPNSDRLNLSAAGVETDERGFVRVNDAGQTNVPHIYALGDINGQGAFTHTAVHDGQVFLDQLTGGAKKMSDRKPIHAMYIDPPLARVGITETEAVERVGRGDEILVATMPMSSVSRAREKSETGGLIKILVSAETSRILGATIFGVGGDELIGMLALAMQADLPYTSLQDTVLPHPTVSELIPWVFKGLKPLR